MVEELGTTWELGGEALRWMTPPVFRTKERGQERYTTEELGHGRAEADQIF